MQKSFCSLFALVLFSIAIFAGPGDTASRIAELKGNPWQIDTALSGTQDSEEVKAYFRSLYENPEQIRNAIRNTKTPIAFKKHLVQKISYWITQNKLPNPGKGKAAYVFALLSAFRDPGPVTELRELAYKSFRAVQRNLDDTERSSVLNSLRQHQTSTDGKEVALPALVFLEPLENTIKLLQSLGDETPEIQQRVMEALARENLKGKKNQLEVQKRVVSFVLSDNEKVRESAALVLYDKRDSVLADRDRLLQEPLELLAQALSDPKTNAESSRLAATILGVNRETTFFEARSVEADDAIHQALVKALSHPDGRVRRSAAIAFEKIKPPDTESQLAIANAITSEADPETARAAFRSLGGQHKHRGDHRVSDESVKEVLVKALLAELSGTKPRKERVEWILNLLDRNPPRRLDLVNLLSEVHELLPEGANQARVRDIIRNANLSPKEIDQSPWAERTVELLQQRSKKDSLFKELAEALKRSGVGAETIGKLLGSEQEGLRDTGLELFKIIPSSRFSEALRTPQLEEGLVSALLRKGAPQDYTRRSRLLDTLHKNKRPVESENLWRAIIANLNSANPEVRKSSARLIQAQLSVRGRDRTLPLNDGALVEQLQEALSQTESAAAAQTALDKLKARGCAEAVKALSPPDA